MPRRLLLSLLALLLLVGSVHAVIKAILPLNAMVDGSDYILVAQVEKFLSEKPAMILTVEEDLKGKSPFRRLPVSLQADPKDAAKHFQPEILKRLGEKQKIILFLSQRGENLTTFAFTNGTWFHLNGQKTEEDKAVWSFVTGEPFLRRTFKGTTAELQGVLKDAISGKKKAPAPNKKDEPGFGPEFDKKSSSLPGGMRLFGVIPTLGVGGPLAILAILFPTVFGGVLVLFRQWIAFITLFSINSTLLLLHALLGGSFRDTWLAQPAVLFLVMGAVSLFCFLWAWRRQVSNISMGPAAIETPERTENIVLAILSGVLLGVMILSLWLTGWNVFEINNKVFLVLSIGVWVAALGKVAKSLIRSRSLTVPISTEGVMIVGSLIASVVFLLSRNTQVNATVFQGEAEGDLLVQLGATDEPEKGAERWRYVVKNPGVFVSTPFVDADRVYAASAHPTFKFGILHCIDRHTGKPLWTFDDKGKMKQVYSSPTAVDGRVYIGEGFHDDPDCKLYCVDAQTGKKLWAHETKGQTESSPTVTLGRVYFGAGNVGFLCLDAIKGKELWSFPPADYKGRLLRFCGTPAVAHGRVFTGTGVDRNQLVDKGETAILALDARTGKLIWQVPAPLPCWGMPVVEGDRLYVTLGNGDILADADSYNPEEKNRGAVWCLKLETGEVLWQKEFPNGILNEVALDGQHLYFGCRSGECYCLDKKDGAVKWKQNLGSPIVGAPSLARLGTRSESVFVVSAYGRCAALNPDTGMEQWKVQFTKCFFTASPRHLLTRGGRQIFVAGAIDGDDVGDVHGSRAVVYCLEDRVTKR